MSETIEFYTNDERQVLNYKKKGGPVKKINMTDEEYIEDFLKDE